MRGQPPVELPAAARDRLNELTLARDAALDSARSVTARLTNRDLDERMRDKLQAEQSKHNARHAQLARLLSATNQWLMELRGVTLEEAAPITFRPKDSETPLAAVERLRGEIVATRQRLQSVRSAPLPLDAQRGLIVQAVAEKARAGRPTVRIANDAATISWGEGTSLAGMLAWVDPARLIDALTAELDEPEGAMSVQERTRKVAELEAALDQLERQEAALIEYAHANGVDVLPRPDLSPAAFLSCVIAPARAQQVA